MNYFKKIAILIFGNVLVTFGIALSVAANLGADPLTVLYQGSAITFGLDIGIVSFIINGIFLLLSALADRKLIKFGTVISMISLSVFLDFFIPLLSNYNIDQNLISSYIGLLAGIIIIGIGSSICISANIGPNVIDVFLQVVIAKTKLSVKYSKISLDIFNIILGVSLGGLFGIGTIINAMTLGFIYEKSLNFIKKHFPSLDR